MGDLDLNIGIQRNAGEGLVGAALGTLTRDGGVRAVEQRGLQRVLVPSGVAVVRLVSLVTTLIAQGLLIGPREVSVPGQEVASDMNVERLLNVGGDKVIVAVPTSRADILGRLWGQRSQALNRTNVRLLFGLAECGPFDGQHENP